MRKRHKTTEAEIHDAASTLCAKLTYDGVDNNATRLVALIRLIIKAEADRRGVPHETNER